MAPHSDWKHHSHFFSDGDSRKLHPIVRNACLTPYSLGNAFLLEDVLGRDASPIGTQGFSTEREIIPARSRSIIGSCS
jgi:hypothetical protein